ncbi:MAG: PilZ domain-containing protein [Phycisphaerales bacterium]|nr:PilZ domain-containing protein [Phycisphaerales bacterium]MCB9854875.1 PilZ domain-containing protein [Phycisphaerales bacterium]MCB9865003.1 PilZ domain-containing protein [Phycisphaerales bacterium]
MAQSSLVDDNSSESNAKRSAQTPSTRTNAGAAPNDPLASAPSPAQLIEMLSDQKGAGPPTKEKREAKRYSWKIQLRVMIVDPAGSKREIDVMTHDLSTSGFSFMYNQYLHNGTVVIACIKALPNQPKVLCVVRNCIHVRGASHRVGVRFEKTATDR